MTAALGGGELATEWVTLLPETATLAKRLKQWRPDPIRVPVEADYDEMEREGQRSGRRTGQSIHGSVERETRHTGTTAGNNIAHGLSNHRGVETAARRVGQGIRNEIEDETRKISFRHIGAGLLGVGRAVGETASGVMTIIRNVGTMATVIRYAARAARGLSLSLLAGATAARVITGAGISRLGVALGFTAKQADRLATQVARVTSALLVAAAVGKFLSFMHSAAKVMSMLTIGGVALAGVLAGTTQLIAGPLYAALLSLGSGLGIAAGAAAGLLGPMLGIAKIGFSGMSEGIKSVQKDWKDLDEAFYKTIGERMRPMLESWRNLSNGITDTMSSALQPAFGNLGTLMDRLAPKSNMLARTFGDLGNEVTNGLLGPVATSALDKMFDASNRFFRSFLGESGITGAITGLLQFSATAADTFSSTGQGINEALLKFGEWLRGITPAQMKMVFETIKVQIQNVMNVVKPLWDALRQLANISAPAMAPAFKAVGDAIKDATPGIMNMASIIMPALSKVIQNLAPSIPALVQAFTPMATILSVILPPLASLVTQLAPLAPIILAVATAVKVATMALALYNTAMLIYSNAGKIATGIQWAWNAAMAANPIGLIVAAVVAAGVALWAFFTKTEVGRKLWDKIWTGIKTAVSVVWESVLKPFFNWFATQAWPRILEAGKRAWEVLKQIFSGIGTALSFAWNNVLKPVFKVIQAEWKILWFAVQVGWEIGKRVFEAVGKVLSWVWNSILSPIFDQFKAVWDFLVEKLQWFQSVWTAVWDSLKVAVQAVWDFLKPVRDFMGDMFSKIGDAGKAAGSAIKSAWDGLANILKSPLNAIGRFLQGLPDSVMGIEIPFVGELKGWGASLAGLRSGGIIQGPGTGTSDSILGVNNAGVPIVRVSNGEGVVPADRMQSPIGRMLFGMLMRLPTFASGGVVGEAINFAKNMGDGRKYVYGGTGPGFDCSGFMSAIYAKFTGKNPKQRHFTTESNFEALGFKKGYMPGAFNVGIKRGGGGRLSHMAGTLPNGVDVESGGAHGSTMYGGAAKGAKDFPLQYYLPITGGDPSDSGQSYSDGLYSSAGMGGSGGSISGGSYGGSGGGGSSGGGGGYSGYWEVDDKKVMNAQDRVEDLTNSLDIKQKKLDEYLAKQAAGEKISDTTIEAARDAVDKQSRELEQAKVSLEEAKRGKYVEGKDPDKRSKGDSESGGSENWGEVGKMIFGGFLESFGLDGSVFSNLLETPNVKSAMAGLNWGLGLLTGDKENAEAGAAQDLGLGSGGGGLATAGMDMLAGIGDQAGVNIAPHGDMAMAGATPGPGNGPVFDLRGSQLGVSPAAFEDKMGEMTAASRRHPTLGPN